MLLHKCQINVERNQESVINWVSSSRETSGVIIHSNTDKNRLTFSMMNLAHLRKS